ncbi:MAG: hypothetical protein ACLFTS_02380 [Candidatus Paceibacterota bacterium]
MESTWTWSQKRQAKILLVFSGVVFLVAAILMVRIFLVEPEVEEVKKGQDPAVVWSNVFSVQGDSYGAVARFVNRESQWLSPEARYRFIFYDEEGEIIKTRAGKTFFKDGESFFAFERDITFEEPPAWTGFMWENIEWQQLEEKEDENDSDYRIKLHSIDLSSDLTRPQLKAVIENTGLLHIPSVEAVVVISDEYDNLVSASRAVTDSISFEGNARLNMSWPEPFTFSESFCDPPLSARVLLLGGDRSDAGDLLDTLKGLEEEIEKGFSWEFDSNEVENVDDERLIDLINKEEERLASAEDQLLFILFPERAIGKSVADKLSEVRKEDSIKTIPIGRYGGGELGIRVRDIETTIRQNCTREPDGVDIHTRIKE